MTAHNNNIRLFTALDVPGVLKRQITDLPDTMLNFKSRVHPDDLHLTLRFLGEVSPEKLPQIKALLEDMKKPVSFSVEVSGVAAFEKKNKAVLYAAVPSTKKLSFLSDAITQKMLLAGLSFESRPFVPHITIARLNGLRSVDDYAKKYGSKIRAQWTSSAFHLMQSASAVQGEKRYTVLQSYKLDEY